MTEPATGSSRSLGTEERRLRVQARAACADTPTLDPLLQVEERVDARSRYELVVDAIAALDPDDSDLVVLIAWGR